MKNTKKLDVSLADIEEAQRRISSIIKKTPTEISREASRLLGCEVFFKLEQSQITGSFKLRGASNKIMSMSAEDRARGVIASSAGNHAQGVAYSATQMGVRSTIVMPVNAPLIKVEATKGYGADIILFGDVVDDATEKAKELVREKGFVFVHPYEDEQIIAGQGTLGLEVHESVPDLDSIIVPIGGGGLISGTAIALKKLNPKIKVIGVVSDQADGMAKMFRGLDPAVLKPVSTIADGIAVKRPSPAMYESFISKYVDEVVTVSDDEIAEAIVFCLEKKKAILEGAGAAALAALFHRKLPLGAKTCVVTCGGNIDLNTVSSIINVGQIRRGRLCEISVIVADVPGSLSQIASIIAGARANVMEVHHKRIGEGLLLKETQIDFVLETRSPAHVEEIKQLLVSRGIRIAPR